MKTDSDWQEPDLRLVGQAPEPDAVLPGAGGDELLWDDGHGRHWRQALWQAQEGRLQAGAALRLGRAAPHLRGPVQHLRARGKIRLLRFTSTGL